MVAALCDPPWAKIRAPKRQKPEAILAILIYHLPDTAMTAGNGNGLYHGKKHQRGAAALQINRPYNMVETDLSWKGELLSANTAGITDGRRRGRSRYPVAR